MPTNAPTEFPVYAALVALPSASVPVVKIAMSQEQLEQKVIEAMLGEIEMPLPGLDEVTALARDQQWRAAADRLAAETDAAIDWIGLYLPAVMVTPRLEKLLAPAVP